MPRMWPLRLAYIYQYTLHEIPHSMAILVVEFSSVGTKLEIFLHKNQHTQTRIVGTLQWNHFLNVEYIMSDIRKLFNSVDPSFFKFLIKNHSLNCCSEISEVT